MEKAVLLALAASFCTATASVCQRLGARSYEGAGFDAWLVFRLARRPVWLLGLVSMILGFVFQISAPDQDRTRDRGRTPPRRGRLPGQRARRPAQQDTACPRGHIRNVVRHLVLA